ncbi:MAG: exonuclease [Acidobacteriia bacterium]|nr:exonuclease [Terriglobia bacterium]
MRNQEADPRFVAIDIKTADRHPDSACSVAAVQVEQGRVVDSMHALVRPPRKDFVLSYSHGITRDMVAGAATFAQVWPGVQKLIRGVDFVAAHNALFHRTVVQACCTRAGMAIPDLYFKCTERIAREIFGIYPTDLSNVCCELRIPLEHHDVKGAALACAQIVLAHARRRQPAYSTPGR